MGTRIAVEFWLEDKLAAEQITEKVFADFRSVEALLSPYIETSELYRVNREASEKSIEISAEFFQLLQKSLYFSKVSHGAFDVSFASVGYHYDYRQGKAPTEQQISQGLNAVDYKKILLDEANSSVRFLHPDLKIDLGGIAKGYAVDRAIGLLAKAGVDSAIVSAGGDSRIIGDRRGTPWMIGIKHPRKKAEYVARIPLENTAISTSGDYERFYLQGEKRIHHILDPKSGKPATEVQSASIMAAKAVDTDALSTTVFVLGVRQGLELVNSLPEVEAVIIDGQGALHFSQGLLRAVTPDTAQD